MGTYSGGLWRGTDLAAMERVAGPHYVNLNAIEVRGDVALVGGLDEGAYALIAGEARALPVGACLPGPDVTGFAVWDGALVAATRSGAWVVPAECGG